MAFSKTSVSAFAAVAIGAPLALFVGLTGPASSAEDTADRAQPPVQEIDLEAMSAGTGPATPWLSDGTIRTPDARIPVPEGLDITTFAQVGPASFVAIDDTTGSGSHNRVVRIDRDGVTELAEGPVTRPFVVSDGADRIAWAEWNGERGQLVLANPDNGKVLQRTPIDTETYTVGFSQRDVVLERAAGGPAQVWRPGTGITEIPGTEGATATDPDTGLISVVTGHREDPETGYPLACSAVIDPNAGNDQVFNTCDSTPLGFSPDGKYIWARDTRTDQAVPAMMFLVDASTGERLLHIRTFGTLRRASWEPDGSVLMDVWNNGKVALVRCGLEPGSDCELATEPVNHVDHSLEAPLPYLLVEGS